MISPVSGGNNFYAGKSRYSQRRNPGLPDESPANVNANAAANAFSGGAQSKKTGGATEDVGSLWDKARSASNGYSAPQTPAARGGSRSNKTDPYIPPNPLTSEEKWQKINGLSDEERKAFQEEYNLNDLPLEKYYKLVEALEKKGVVEPAWQLVDASRGDFSPDAIVVPAYPTVSYPGDPRIPNISSTDSPYEALKKNIDFTSAMRKKFVAEYGDNAGDIFVELYDRQKLLLDELEAKLQDKLAGNSALEK